MSVRTVLRNCARILLLGVVATCTDQRSTTAPLATGPLALTPQVLPVIAPNLLTAGQSITNAKTYTTGFISPSPNKLVLVAVMGVRTFGASPSPTVSGGGMATWTETASMTFDSITFPQRRITIYRAVSATPGSGPITFSFNANQSNAQWIVVQWDGVVTSGFHGDGAIGQIGSNRGDLVNGLTVSLDPFANSGNVAFAVFGAASGVHGLPMINPGSGFAELTEQVSQEATPSDFQAQWATSLNTIAATWNSLHGSALAIELNVAVPAPVATVTVDPATASVEAEATLPLTAILKDAAGNSLTGREVTWASSDDAVATVTQTGLVTGVAGGFVTITATSEGQSGTAAVTVTPLPVATVTVDPATASVNEWATQQLTATLKDAAGNPLTGRVVTWESSDPALATVTETGLVTGRAVGSVTITATSEGQSGAAVVTVTPVPVATVTVAPATASVNMGETLQLTATARDQNGNPLTRVVTWATSDAAVATVTATGLVRGVAAGAVTIAATTDGRVGTASVTVNGAFSHTLLTFGTNTANARVYTTASISPAARALVTVAVLQYSSQGTPPNPTLSGGGMQTWDVVATVMFDPGIGGFPMQRLTIFRAMSATPGSGPITITAPTVALSHAHWSVSQWTGVATGGVNGAGAIRQAGALAGDRVNGLVVPLTSLASPTNITYGAFGVQIVQRGREIDRQIPHA